MHHQAAVMYMLCCMTSHGKYITSDIHGKAISVIQLPMGYSEIQEYRPIYESRVSVCR